MSSVSRSSSGRSFSQWAVIALAILLALIGLVLLAGGVYLITLGGSWYYAVTGLLLLASGGLMARMNLTGALIYIAAAAGSGTPVGPHVAARRSQSVSNAMAYHLPVTAHSCQSGAALTAATLMTRPHGLFAQPSSLGTGWIAAGIKCCHG